MWGGGGEGEGKGERGRENLLRVPTLLTGIVDLTHCLISYREGLGMKSGNGFEHARSCGNFFSFPLPSPKLSTSISGVRIIISMKSKYLEINIEIK